MDQAESPNVALNQLVSKSGKCSTILLGGDFNVRDIIRDMNHVNPSSTQRVVNSRVLEVLSDHHLETTTKGLYVGGKGSGFVLY